MGPGDVGTPGPLVSDIHDMPLSERLERANLEFSGTFRRKTGFARTGARPYPNSEFYRDLYIVSDKYGLYPGALWVYFWALYKP